MGDGAPWIGLTWGSVQRNPGKTPLLLGILKQSALPYFPLKLFESFS
jgi:hypothetical protein